MANEYVSLAEFKEERRITGTAEDDRITRILTRASRAIDNRCGRFFYRTDLTARTMEPFGRTVSRYGVERLIVDDIASATGLAVGQRYRGADAYTPVTNYTVDPPVSGSPITSLSLTSWYAGGSDIQITAEWGWPSIPDAIQEACFLLANRRFQRRSSPEGIAGWAEQGPVSVSRFDPDIEDLVGPYVIVGFGS